MKKWMIGVIAMIMVISLGLVGCTSDNTTKETEPSTSTEAQDTLVVGRGGESSALDPAIVTDGESIMVTEQIFESLLSYKEGTTEVQPSLAESYQVSPDGLKYSFKLREGVKFHDGTDFNADAVVFNYNRWNDPNSPYKFEGETFGYYTNMFGPPEARVIKEVKAVDAYNVEFVLNKPSAPFLQNVAMPVFGIASPKAIQEKKENFKTEPVGTGPFMFKEWKRNDSITLEKNPNYWKSGYPKLNKLIIRSIPDNSARFTALNTGEIDLMEGVSPENLEEIESNPELQKLTRPSFNIGYVGFNVTRKPFDNPKVRQALSHAVNKAELIEAFHSGLGVPAKNPLPPSLWGHNDAIEDYPYDLEKAKALLAEAGYPNGIDQELVFYAMPVARPYMPDGKKVTEALQAEFAKIGVKTKIQSPEWSVYLTDLIKGDKADLFLLGGTGDNGDPDNFLYTMLDKDTIGVNNLTFYSNDELHQLFLAAQSEQDQAKRADMYKKAQEIIHADAPMIPLVHSTPLLAAKANLKGYVPSPKGTDPYTNVYFE